MNFYLFQLVYHNYAFRIKKKRTCYQKRNQFEILL